jgi:uncharacterized protein (TIGR03435 family)
MKASPGRLTVICTSVRIMLQSAWLIYANGHYRDFNFYDVPIEAAPDWSRTERYTIEASSAVPRSEEMMKGPMLQSLLEDRFRLRLHLETREVPIYELVVANGGHKLKAFDGACKPVDWAKPSQPLPGPGDCHNVAGVSGANSTRYWRAISIDDFTMAILDKQFVGRPVVNRTGITGLFDIHLEFTPEQNAERPDAGPSIFTALQQQLGLKLISARGPEEFIVIESVERPSEN